MYSNGLHLRLLGVCNWERSGFRCRHCRRCFAIVVGGTLIHKRDNINRLTQESQCKAPKLYLCSNNRHRTIEVCLIVCARTPRQPAELHTWIKSHFFDLMQVVLYLYVYVYVFDGKIIAVHFFPLTIRAICRLLQEMSGGKKNTLKKHGTWLYSNEFDGKWISLYFIENDIFFSDSKEKSSFLYYFFYQFCYGNSFISIQLEPSSL